MYRKIPSLLLIGVLIGLSCDERKKDDDNGQCFEVCVNISCQIDAAEGFLQGCADDCVERHAKAADVGEGCADRYSALLDCLEPLDCNGGRYWWVLKGTDNDYECKDETQKFNAECPGLWFDPQ